MTLFGNPRTSRRNLWGGLLVTAFGALQLGLSIESVVEPERWPGGHRSAWLLVGLSALVTLSGVMQFRLGLRAARFSRDGEPAAPAPGRRDSASG
jgi:hypothetical protein